MITLNLDWREVLWWLQGGMAGSHLRWSVYKKIEAVLEKACDSIDNQPREYFYRGEQTTYHLVKEMYETAIRERKYIEGKINAFKEL